MFAAIGGIFIGAAVLCAVAGARATAAILLGIGVALVTYELAS